MPSRRTKSTAINERISEAQKGRTRLACRVCRSRRIKCDGQKGACGRCRQDKRTDCSYENVGSAERMAGRQRKRALRKQHVSDDDNASVSTERGGHEESVDEQHQDWTSPLLNSTTSPILTSPQQAQQLIQNFYHNTSTTAHLQPPSFTTPASSSTIAAIRKHKPSNESIQQRRVKLTPVSSSLSSSTLNRGDESSSARYDSSLLTSMQSSGSEEANQLASGYPNGSWVLSPPTIAHDQQPIPHIHQPAFDYQSNPGIDPGSVDSLWRVYDWQYRCNSGMLPQHFSQPVPSSTAFTP